MQLTIPPGWSLVPLDRGLRPAVDPAPSLRERRPLPPGAEGVGVVTGPISGVWWGPAEGAPAVVAWPDGSAGLYPERGSGRGWQKAGAVVPIEGPGVVWLSGSAATLVPRSEVAQVLRAYAAGDPRALLRVAEEAGVEASEIAPLQGEWPEARWPRKPTPIPWELAPDALAGIIFPLARSTGYSVSGAGVVVCGLAAAALSGRVEIDMEGAEAEDGSVAWSERNPALYVVTVAPSSARKSPLFVPLLRPWYRYQARVRAQGQERRKEWKRAQTLAKVRERGKPDEGAVEEIVEALEAPEPRVPAVMTDDATPAAFADEIARHASLLYASPEAGTFFARCVSDTGATDIKPLLNAYSGDPSLPTLRMGRTTAPASGAPLRAALVGAIQPGVLFGVGRVDAFADQGLLARILWAVWDEPCGEGGRAFPASAAAAWEALLERFWAIPGVERDEEGHDRGHLRRVVVSAAGTRRLLALSARLKARAKPGRDLHVLESWVGKAHGQAARLAALFALAEDARATEIPDRWVEAAIDVVELGLLEHAIAAWSLTRWPPETRTAIHLWAAMRAAGPVWTVSKIAQRAGAVDIAPADVASAVKALVERGFLRAVGPGTWYANPRAEDPPDLD